jgi:hypothetical protein
MSAQDLRAAAEVHKELGPAYGDAVVDSFLEKIEARLDERVNARLAELVPPRQRLLAGLSRKGRHNLLAGIAIGLGAFGIWLGLLYYRIEVYRPEGGLWATILIVSAASCGAGLARLFPRHREETPGSGPRNN